MFKKLERTKVFRDPIYGYIEVDLELISKLIDSKEVQRLRRIRQLSGVGMVFQTAEHSRFCHAYFGGDNFRNGDLGYDSGKQTRQKAEFSRRACRFRFKPGRLHIFLRSLGAIRALYCPEPCVCVAVHVCFDMRRQAVFGQEIGFQTARYRAGMYGNSACRTLGGIRRNRVLPHKNALRFRNVCRDGGGFFCRQRCGFGGCRMRGDGRSLVFL